MDAPGGIEAVSRETLLAWKKGDTKSFEIIVKSTMKRAFAIAVGIVGNPEDAKDLSQEAYIAAHRARKRFDENRPFFPWFYRLLRNRCLNFVARRSRRMEVSLDLVEYKFDSNSSPDGRLLQKERRETLWKALFELPPEQREIIVLRCFQEMSYREISRVLGVPEGTVMSRLFYARGALSRALKALPGAEGNGRE